MTISENEFDATTDKPSVVSIVTMYVLALVALGCAVFTTTGEIFDGRHLVGFLTGFTSSVVFTIQAGVRFRRRVDALRAERQREDEALRYVGTWMDPDSREPRLTVRFDLQTGRYLALGWIAAGWEVEDEFAFAGPGVAFVALVEAERDGMVPSDDEGTRLVRARLRMPGWDEAYTDAYMPV